MKASLRKFMGASTVKPKIVKSYAKRWLRGRPLLSVVIPCYNYGRYIKEALDSVNQQTFQDFEVIVVDDGSTEEATLRVLAQLKRQGVRVLRKVQVNRAAALNLGIAQCRGKYICCLDADDKLEPTYFEKCLSLLESNPGISFAYSLIRLFGAERRVGWTEPFNLRVLLEYNHICAPAVFRKDGWDVVGGYDPVMDGYEDWEFWINLAKAGYRGQLIPEVLFNYRRHGRTMIHRAEQMRQRLIARIRANHKELYSHPEHIETIERKYRDISVVNPFVNLRFTKQYASYPENLVLVIADGKPRNEWILHAVLGELQSRKPMRFLLAGMDSNRQADTQPYRLTKLTYNLANFLEPYCWLDFVINLIRTKAICLIVISHSKNGYEWIPRIKRATSAKVIDFLSDDEREYCKLSLKYEKFIDAHVSYTRQSEIKSDPSSGTRVLAEQIRCDAERIVQLLKLETS